MQHARKFVNHGLLFQLDVTAFDLGHPPLGASYSSRKLSLGQSGTTAQHLDAVAGALMEGDFSDHCPRLPAPDTFTWDNVTTRALKRGPEEIVTQNKPVLYIVACGARPASQTARIVASAQQAGFTACVVTTPMAERFIDDIEQLQSTTGYLVRSNYKQPEEADALPLPNAFLVAPLTFNTLNAWATGLSTTLALGLLNESFGMEVPVTAVPWLNAQLAAHPAALPSLERLRAAGVHFTSGFAHPSTRIPGPDGQVGTPKYPWSEIEQAIESMHQRCVRP
jgi:hypothetical protein